MTVSTSRKKKKKNEIHHQTKREVVNERWKRLREYSFMRWSWLSTRVWVVEENTHLHKEVVVCCTPSRVKRLERPFCSLVAKWKMLRFWSRFNWDEIPCPPPSLAGFDTLFCCIQTPRYVRLQPLQMVIGDETIRCFKSVPSFSSDANTSCQWAM